MKKEGALSFNINTLPEKYFYQLIEILSMFPPFSKMRIRQKEVLAEILYMFYTYKTETQDVKERIVFDHKTREQIAEKIGITKGNLYNIYKELRQLGILTKEGIDKKYKFEYMKYSEIIFKFENETNNNK